MARKFNNKAKRSFVIFSGTVLVSVGVFTAGIVSVAQSKTKTYAVDTGWYRLR